MTSHRPYRRAQSDDAARAEIARCSGTQFDPEVVRAFMDIGVAGLRKIKDDMAARKSRPAEVIAAEAHAAEVALDQALDGNG